MTANGMAENSLSYSTYHLGKKERTNLKKTLSLFLVFFMLFALVSTVSAAEQPITVKINGETQTYNQPPVIKSGSTLVPLRGIFESLGASVFYDASTKKIHATKGSTVVELQLGKKEALVNGKKVTLSVAAEVMNGSTMVPLRFISESLGLMSYGMGQQERLPLQANKAPTNQ